MCDRPLVASALAVDAAVWPEDDDLLGTGVAAWTTATLRSWLDNTTRT
ncbi:MAG TPA: PIN domain-containing protein [Acidimicrobiales bacterium]